MGQGRKAIRYSLAAAIAVCAAASPVFAASHRGQAARTQSVRRTDARDPVQGPVATAYGQVVASGPNAFVLALSSGAWLAVNLAPGTSVSGPGGLGGPSGPGVIPQGDWVWVQYGPTSAGRDAAYAAAVVRYSSQPFAVGRTVHLSGTITGLNPGGFTLEARGHLYLVAVSTQTVVRLGGILSALTFIQSNDHVTVQGYLTGATIVATSVQYTVGAGGHARPGKPPVGPGGHKNGQGHKVKKAKRKDSAHRSGR